MKKIVFISGAICSSAILLGWLFKVMHWPFADAMILFSVLGLALVFIPAYAWFAYHKSETKK